MLERRVLRLEKILKIPIDQRHTSENDLKKTSSIFIEGVRVHSRLEGMHLDSIGQVVAHSPKTPLSQSQLPFPVKKLLFTTFKKGESSSLEKKGDIRTEVRTDPPSFLLREPDKFCEVQPSEKKGKSIWVGRDGEQVSVEILALQYYEDRGYKGFGSTLQCMQFADSITHQVSYRRSHPYHPLRPLVLGRLVCPGSRRI